LRQHLDRRTGASLAIASDPWVFAREQPHLAAHARDYLSLHALDVNVGGRRATYLAVFDWSTVDRRRRPTRSGDARLLLLLDDRRVPLGDDVEPRAAGLSEWPLERPGRGARLRVYPVEGELLRYWSKAASVRIVSEGDPDDPEARFESWREGRAALARLIESDGP
jgi:hypothetical protein